jgi:hypothetical protein
MPLATQRSSTARCSVASKMGWEVFMGIAVWVSILPLYPNDDGTFYPAAAVKYH